MKFEPGQILKHNPSGSRWIVTKTEPYTENRTNHYRLLVTAYCLYSGSKPDYWQPNQVDHWVMTDEDCELSDKIWQIIEKEITEAI